LSQTIFRFSLDSFCAPGSATLAVSQNGCWAAVNVYDECDQDLNFHQVFSVLPRKSFFGLAWTGLRALSVLLMNALFNSSKVFFLFLYNIKYQKIWSEKYMTNSEYRAMIYVNKKKFNKA